MKYLIKYVSGIFENGKQTPIENKQTYFQMKKNQSNIFSKIHKIFVHF